MDLNYSKISSSLLRVLPQRQRDVISRRFGLAKGKQAEGETLESIGESFGITRERVRQIENDAFSRLKPEMAKYQKTFQYLNRYLKEKGGLRKEEILLNELGKDKNQNQVSFLLHLGSNFKKYSETPDYYPFWAINDETVSKFQKAINSSHDKLKAIGKPVQLKELASSISVAPNILNSYIEVSKKIQKNNEGFFGLKEWPEINQRGIKNKAYFVFKKEQKPLHFTRVAQLIYLALPQTVHNELIKDPRFVLVGRGTYALKEWGYEEGAVKDVIDKILRESKKPLTKEEILEKTLKQRLVKRNTILLNLNNKKYFLKTPEGNYKVQET